MSSSSEQKMIKTGYHCSSHDICRASWKLRFPKKWAEIDATEQGFSVPMVAHRGRDYKSGGLMSVAMNVHYDGGEWDGIITGDDGELLWKPFMLKTNLDIFIHCLFRINNGSSPLEYKYVFTNMIKCSPNKHLSRRCWPNPTQFQQCISVKKHIWNEIEQYNPSVLICLGYDVFEQILALYGEKRLALHEKIMVNDDVGHGFAILDNDTIALGIPHLSGGMRSINNVNKRFEAGTSPAEYTPTLKVGYVRARKNLEAERAIMVS